MKNVSSQSKKSNHSFSHKAHHSFDRLPARLQREHLNELDDLEDMNDVDVECRYEDVAAE